MATYTEILQTIALGTIIILSPTILSVLFIFLFYLLITVLGPWILSALIAAGISYGLSLFIVMLPALIFAAPLFARVCFAVPRAIRAALNRHDHDEGVQNHLDAYLARRKFNGSVGYDDPVTIFFLINYTLAASAGIGVGGGLSVLIVPTFITALVAGGTPYLLALSTGVVMGGALIILTTLFLMLPIWIYWRIMALPAAKDLKENPLQLLPLLSMFAGLAFGAYLSSLVVPLLLAALTPLGISHAAVIFTVIIICSELILTTSFCSFIAASGISYLFNHVNFKPFVDGWSAFITSLSRFIERPKPLPKIVDPDPIKQAIAEYHQNKSFWRKLLFSFSRSLGTDPDIEKIEGFLKKNPKWQENQKALKSLLRERAVHTHGTYRFYTHSPNNPVNKAYMAIAKAMANQLDTEPPNYAAWSHLLEFKANPHDAEKDADANATDLLITEIKLEFKSISVKPIRKMIGLPLTCSPAIKRLVEVMSDILPQGIRIAYEASNNLPPELCQIISGQYDESVPLDHILHGRLENQETTLAARFQKGLKTLKENVLSAFILHLLATFYDEESDIAFEEVHTYAAKHGLLEGDILHDLSLFKLLNPLRWVEFLLRLGTGIFNGLISTGVWFDSRISDLLNEIIRRDTSLASRLGIPEDSRLLHLIVSFLGIFIVGVFRYCISLPIKIICNVLIVILTSVTSAAVFLLRSLSAPIDTVLTPWLKLYREQPVKFFSLLLVSAALVGFLMIGFGLGAYLPGLMWLSNHLFALASLASAGSPVLMVIMSTLLIGLLMYETMAILDALIIPFTIMALTTLKNGLYYLSEIRFQAKCPTNLNLIRRYCEHGAYGHTHPPESKVEEYPPLSADDILPQFDSRYPVSLEMPSLSIQPYVCLNPERFE